MGDYKRNNDNLNKDSGIYCITNVINNKKYIGQTYSLKYRWKRHKSDLKNNCHSNKHLQNAWNKYGKDAFQFSIIELCPIEELSNKEKYWIQYYDTFNSGYNLTIGDIGCSGYKHTQEEIEKMRNYYSPKKVLQLDLNFNIINEWVSLNQVAIQLGLFLYALKNCCEKKNHVKSVAGYIWIYKEDFENLDHNYYSIKNIALPKKVGQFDGEMNLIKIWNSIYETKKEFKSTSTISNVCNHKRNSYKGFIWAFVDDFGFPIDNFDYSCIRVRKYNKIQQYDLNENLIATFNSLNEASNLTTISKYGISDCCKGKKESYKNYIWKYA